MNVNSFDEWSALKEVIVGSPINYNTNDIELSFKLFFHDNAYDSVSCYYPTYKTKSQKEGDADKSNNTYLKNTIKNQYLEELAEDVSELVQVLEKLNVKVHRPFSLNKGVTFKTPYWNATCIPALNIRDQAIIVGNEIIETPPQIRARYFENDLLKSIFYRYFNAGAKWTTMPKPMMTDNSFDIAYVEEQIQDIIATQKVYKQEASEFDVGHEIMIDAAQCVRFGKDILVN
nr:glycine amidinotransferase [Tatlockia sp.]